ncbi:MAG: flavin reductase family protein [Deltaproteobacteria bacterium]|nr:flavin reductase family protein [Deltaproteobacteria bacterium]
MPIKPEISLAQKYILQGVFVISTAHNGKVNALTAAWVTRASFVPPLITVSIGKARYSHHMIMESGVFAVNVLGPEHIETGKHFGLKTGAKTNKFENIEYNTKVTGSPILKDCISWMDCKVASWVDAGDHTIFVGEVLDGGVVKEGKPLIYERDTFYK